MYIYITIYIYIYMYVYIIIYLFVSYSLHLIDSIQFDDSNPVVNSVQLARQTLCAIAPSLD